MALSEDGEDPPDQNTNNTASTEQNDAGAGTSGSESGPRNEHHPVPAVDHFNGELPPNMDMTSINIQTVLSSRCERVTSVSGSNQIDQINRATVLKQQYSHTFVPYGELREDEGSMGDSSPNNVSSTGTAAAPPPAAAATDTAAAGGSETICSEEQNPILTRSCESESQATAFSFSTPISLGSLNMDTTHDPNHSAISESSSPTGEDTTVSVEDPKSKGFKNPESSIQHFAESSEIPDAQVETSGYQSETSVSTCLQLSETGINALKCVSGTQCNPVFPGFATFLSRLTSFPERFSLGNGVDVNRDLLTLAGFFYSGYSTVTCFHCGCSPRIWGDGRDPATEHRMLSPYCRALPRP